MKSCVWTVTVFCQVISDISVSHQVGFFCAQLMNASFFKPVRGLGALRHGVLDRKQQQLAFQDQVQRAGGPFLPPCPWLHLCSTRAHARNPGHAASTSTDRHLQVFGCACVCTCVCKHAASKLKEARQRFWPRLPFERNLSQHLSSERRKCWIPAIICSSSVPEAQGWKCWCVHV